MQFAKLFVAAIAAVCFTAGLTVYYVIDKRRRIAEDALEELRRQAGKAGTSLEDIFLDLVAEQSSVA